MAAPLTELPLPGVLRYALATPAGRYLPTVRDDANVHAGEVIAVRPAPAAPRPARPEENTPGAWPPDEAAADLLRAAASGRIELAADAIALHVDGRGEPPPPLTARGFVERVCEAGIVGMGGAGYPAHLKLRDAMAHGVVTVIVNGVECEPGVAVDRALLECHAEDVLRGMQALTQALGGAQAVLALDAPLQLDAPIKKQVVPGPYPAGWEPLLVQRLLGLEMPRGAYPVSVGVVVFNVATVFAMARAWHNAEPLTRRVVAIGDEPRWTRIGHPVAELPLAHGEKHGERMLGGPVTGRPAAPGDAVSRTTRAVTLRAAAAPAPCIRCGWCTSACPVGLLPQELLRAATAERWAESGRLAVDDCIECGACDMACPSRLPLLAHFRFAKAARSAAAQREQDAARAKAHVEQRRIRVSRRAAEATTRRAERLRNPRDWGAAASSRPAQRKDEAATEGEGH